MPATVQFFMIMSWHRNWKNVLGLIFLGGNYYSGEVVLSQLVLFQAWNILGQNGLFLFSLLLGLSPGFNHWFSSLSYAFFLATSSSLINTSSMPINLKFIFASSHSSWTLNSYMLKCLLDSPLGCLIDTSNLMCLTLNC